MFLSLVFIYFCFICVYHEYGWCLRKPVEEGVKSLETGVIHGYELPRGS